MRMNEICKLSEDVFIWSKPVQREFIGMYSIKSLSNLIGINTDTIRTWERRYRLVSPQRMKNGRRLYSETDLDFMTLIARLVKAGNPISNLAHLDYETLKELEETNKQDPLNSLEIRIQEQIIRSIDVDDYLSFGRLVRTAFAAFPAAKLADLILVPALKHIGDKWEDGTFDVAQEHSFTAVIKQSLMAHIPTPRWRAHSKMALFTTLDGERHELGALMGSHVAAEDGFDCHYLGSEMPVESLISHLIRNQFPVVVISLIRSLSDDEIFHYINMLNINLPNHVHIYLGCSSAPSPLLSGKSERLFCVNNFEQFKNSLMMHFS